MTRISPSAGFSFFSSNTLSIVYDDYRLQLGTTPGILMDKFLSTQWLFIVIGGMVMIFITMLLTHRIAGPFFRYEKTLDEMMAKNLAYQIFLRKNDDGKELGIQINAFNQMLSSDLHQLVNHCRQIERLSGINNMEQPSSHASDSMNDPSEALIKINQLNQETLSILHDYKLLQE